MIETIHTEESLANRLHNRIRLDGPITFRDWMQAALYDRDYGYYHRRDLMRWGRAGDYRTSPERTSLFGATFARYFVQLYESLGEPDAFTIAEAGAGDGSLAYDVLQTLHKHYPEIFSVTQYVIDEVSHDSRVRATERLSSFRDQVQFAQVGTTKIDSGVVFSNELLDAMPVHRVKMVAGQLCELYVDVDTEGNFIWTEGPLSTKQLGDYVAGKEHTLAEGQITEVNLEISDWYSKVSNALDSGYVVTVDYGSDEDHLINTRPDGTLRGFRNHEFVENLLANPGDYDLTTTVNWTDVKEIGAQLDLDTIKFERLDSFLLSEGLLTQLESELQNCLNDAERLGLSTAAREMILPTSMAAHFQVLVQRKQTH